jgi:cystathionine gamma-synthase
VRDYGLPSQHAMLFPSSRTARRCIEFRYDKGPSTAGQLEVIDLTLDSEQDIPAGLTEMRPCVYAMLFPKENFSLAKQYWQHAGDGVSSRRAGFCHDLYLKGILMIASKVSKPVADQQESFQKGPRRYQQGRSINKTTTTHKRINSTKSAVNLTTGKDIKESDEGA